MLDYPRLFVMTPKGKNDSTDKTLSKQPETDNDLYVREVYATIRRAVAFRKCAGCTQRRCRGDCSRRRLDALGMTQPIALS